MDVTLGYIAIGAGGLGFLLTYLLASSSVSKDKYPVITLESRRTWLISGLIVFASLLIWAIAMQRTTPFSAGQTLGYGFAIGGLAGAIVCLTSLKLGVASSISHSIRTGYLSANNMAFFALFGAGLVFTIFKGNPQPALMGYAIGAAMAGILFTLMQNPAFSRSAMMMEAWSLFSVAISAGIVISIFKFDMPEMRIWWALPLLIGTILSISGYLTSEIASSKNLKNRHGASFITYTIISAVLIAGLTALFSYLTYQNWTIFYTAAAGIVIFTLIGWLFACSTKNQTDFVGVESAAISILLVLAFVVITFKLWAGFGIAVGLIAGWYLIFPAIGLREASKSQCSEDDTECEIKKEENEIMMIGINPISKALIGCVALGISILLVRLFLEEYSDIVRIIDLRVHYTFVCALLGAVLPFVFTSSIFNFRGSADYPDIKSYGIWTIIAISFIGLAAAVSPIVLFVIWGMNATLGFIFGLIASQAFLLMTLIFQEKCPCELRGAALSDYSVSLLVIGAQLVAVQFTKYFMGLDLTRINRAAVLAVIVVISIIWFIIINISAKKRMSSQGAGNDEII
ncbi:MAG: hypothetical protein SNJ70_09445 [Armatimonadota bacterium]